VVLIAAAALLAGGIACMPLVTREVDLLSYFRQGTDIQLAERLMRERFGGSITVQLLVKGDIKEPAVLSRMREAENFLKTQPGLHNASSIVEIVEEMSWALGEGRAIPDSREKVANLWFLLEGEEMIGRMVSPDAREAVISATLERLNSRDLSRLTSAVEGYIAAHTAPDYELALSGSAPIYKRIDTAIASSQLWSLGLAIVFMFACNLFLLRSITGGLIGLIPIVFTLFVLFGVMGAAGIPLDIATVLIGSISLGMGVDYSIHFLSRYRRELAAGKGAADALMATFETTGKAIVINAVTVAVGFLALLLGGLIPLRRFGILIGVTMVSSGLGALTILPAVLLLAPLGGFRALWGKAREAAERARAATRARRLKRIELKAERTKV
jgi:predicted RND superfamily exporter protein